ncbi:hypothetical protein PSACC_03045 [Paramicrosporidium saccamoebae]|uniref:Uncharacterized protein n=1 Tax=Paramicrosporidium saccamoebae TaxID=1246581 RepID=A0A2H9THA2_9FUNG|nr:hypothetical protein PSACC_03045 [Paramicrosporidium saccamoebae]
MLASFVLGVLLSGSLHLVASSDINEIREKVFTLSLSAAPQPPQHKFPGTFEEKKLEEMTWTVKKNREARCSSVDRKLYADMGTGLGLADLERAIQEATVIDGVDFECACEMLHSSAAGKLSPDEIHWESVGHGYRGVLKCLLTVPLKKWPMLYDAHFFLASAFGSTHYDSDFWHARWLESKFARHRKALYASGNLLLFKHIEGLPTRGRMPLLVLNAKSFWKFFATVVWNDAVGTVEYLADQLDLSAIGKRYALLVKYNATNIIHFLQGRNVPLIITAEPIMNKSENVSADANDEAWETANYKADKHLDTSEHVANGAQKIKEETQPEEEDLYTVKRKEWQSLKESNSLRIAERLKKCDESHKIRYKYLAVEQLEEVIGVLLKRGTDVLCLLEAIKTNVNLQKTPSDLLSYATESGLSYITFCMQAFPLTSFQNQGLAHLYMAVLYKALRWDEELWMRLWFDSRLDKHRSVIYLEDSLNLLKDLHQLPQNPDIVLPAHKTEQFINDGLQVVTAGDAVETLQYLEQNYALDLTQVAAYLNTFIRKGARSIIWHLVKSNHVKLGLNQVLLAIIHDQVDIVKIALVYGFEDMDTIISASRNFGAEKCKALFSDFFEPVKHTTPQDSPGFPFMNSHILSLLLSTILFGCLYRVTLASVSELQRLLGNISLADTRQPSNSPKTPEERKLEEMTWAVKKNREARCSSVDRKHYADMGTGLGLADLDKAIHKATVIEGVDAECACEMFHSSAAGKLDLDGIHIQSLRSGYQGVLKCLLTVPLTKWPVAYDAHSFLANAFESAHYDSDFWHARWSESKFARHRKALYASGNLLLFKHLEGLPRRDQTSLPVLNVGLFWKFFRTVAWNDAVGTVEYLADQLDLSAIGKRYVLLVKYNATNIISFLQGRNVSLIITAESIMSKSENVTVAATDGALETTNHEASKHLGTDENVDTAEGLATVDTDPQNDPYIVEREKWKSLKMDNTRRVVERLMKCDKSYKWRYKGLEPRDLDRIFKLELKLGKDIICLAEAIKTNVNLQKTPSDLLRHVSKSGWPNITTCMQAFPSTSFQDQGAFHDYMAFIYKRPGWDEDLWMRFWFDSRFDKSITKIYSSMNVDFFKDLHSLPRNPDLVLPELTAATFLDHGIPFVARYDDLDVLQYFEKNCALSLTRVAEHVATFVEFGATKIIEYLVNLGHVKSDGEYVRLAVIKDRVEIVKLAVKFGFRPDATLGILARLFGAEKCMAYLSTLS